MNRLRYGVLAWLAMMMMGMPMMAQRVLDDEVVETKVEVLDADSLEGDTLPTDSLTTDSLPTDSLRLPWPESMKMALDGLLKDDMFETSQVAMMVWDLQADSCVYRHRERQLMRPASTMKLLTAITALDKLGGSYQFKTQLRYTGKIVDRVLMGDVYCVGGMDPKFNNDDMKAFVNSLLDMGVDTIRGAVDARGGHRARGGLADGEALPRGFVLGVYAISHDGPDIAQDDEGE